MSFFEPPPPPPEPPPGPPPPEWIGPPDNELPSTFPLDLVVVRNDELAIFVHSGRAYTRGFEFALALQTKEPRERRDGHMMRWHAGPGATFDDDVLRFGIAYADGRKATVFDPHPWWRDPERPATPDIVLMQRGGGGGGASWDFRFWAWPLPADGPLEFVAEWPAEGIELTRAAVDSAVVREAAARAVTLWPGGSPHGRSGAWTRSA